MRLEVSLDVDLDRGRERLRVTKCKRTIICLVWFGLLDSWDIKLVDSLCDGREDTVVALVNQ
jgi:hypothetical protein